MCEKTVEGKDGRERFNAHLRDHLERYGRASTMADAWGYAVRCGLVDAGLAKEIDVHAANQAEPHCCEHDCRDKAEFTIRDKGDPDPYRCVTDACSAHVGELLGHAVGTPDDAVDEWVVVPIGHDV